MFGFLGRIFGSDKAIEKGVDSLSSGIDKLFYTSEEKADNEMIMRQKAADLLVNWMGATQGQNIARRLLAMMIAFTWLIMYLAATIMNIAVIWITDNVTIANIQASADIVGERATEMNGAMMLILGFYFAAPHLDKVVEKAMDKFSGDKK